MSLISNTPSTSVHHSSHQLQKSVQNDNRHPSVENARGRLQPTQVEEAAQLTGNHTTVQQLDAQAEAKNPLTSPQQFNSKIAATRL